MTHYRSLNHSKWACQYHEVFIPQYRKKAIYGELRRYLGGRCCGAWRGSGRARWKKGICWSTMST